MGINSINMIPTAGAVATATSAAPTGTTSTTAVMMAIGGAITPVNTGRVLIVVSGQMANGSATGLATVDIRYGTGTAPSNGDAVSGTLVGLAQATNALGATFKDGFCVSGVITGQALGTALWIDASLKATTTGTATITGVSVSLVEI